MTLTERVNDGLRAAVDVMPAHPYVTGLAAATVGAGVIAAGWHWANPDRRAAYATPILSMSRIRGRADVSATGPDPLDIPLDFIPQDAQGRTPFEVIGAGGVRVVVDQFYNKLLGDPTLSPFFDHVDLPRLRQHQALLVGQLWGGPVHYELGALAKAHHPLDISPEQYWRVVGHFMGTLTHEDVPGWICVFTMTRLYQARTFIIRQPPAVVAERAEGAGETDGS